MCVPGKAPAPYTASPGAATVPAQHLEAARPPCEADGERAVWEGGPVQGREGGSLVSLSVLD